MLHPLINQNSKHYDAQEKTAIEMIEERLTVSELIGACKFNILKYEYRKEHKGAKDEDEAKILTYKNYLELLESIHKEYRDFNVSDAYKVIELRIQYR